MATKCSDYNLVTYLNGIQIREATGCVGESQTYTTSTSLPSDVEYEWYLDSILPPSPLLGTNSSYTYTFDGLNHRLFVVAKSHSAGCSIQVDIKVFGVDCTNICEVDCAKETVSFPAGKFRGLIDKFGNTLRVPPGLFFECKSSSQRNNAVCKWIKSYLKSQPNCSNTDIGVSWSFNKIGTNCITLTITNSPVKFMTLLIDTNTYHFDTINC